MATGLVAAGCCAGLRPSTSSRADLASSRVLQQLSLRRAHVVAHKRGVWNPQWSRQRSGMMPVKVFFPADPWAPGNAIDSQSVASSLFAVSLFPYLGFLYHLTKSKTAPKLTLFGFYFLLVFVGVTIPAGIYAKVHYGKSLSNVDWLHGSAESFLTLTNLFIAFGLRGALSKDAEDSSKIEADQEEKLPLSK